MIWLIIYYEDGELNKSKELGPKVQHIIDAKYGYSHCLEFLERLNQFYPNVSVYTNFHEALNSKYCKDGLYLYKNNNWILNN